MRSGKPRRTMASKTRRRRKRVLLRRHGPKCARCRSTFPVSDLTLDHIVPISKGGVDALTNLQLMCQPCNNRKGAKLPKNIEVRAWHPERVNGGRGKVAA